MSGIQPGAAIKTVMGVPSAETWLSLTPGEEVTAFVQAARDDSAVLYLKGAWVNVRHEGILQEGASVRLAVTGQQQDGSWLLKLLSSPAEKGETVIPGKDLAGVLRSWEVEPTPINLSLAREVTRQGLPLTAQALNLLSRAVSNLQIDHGRFPALVWLWARGLPLSGTAVELVARLLATPLAANEHESWKDFSGRLQAREWPPALAEKVSQLESLLEQVTLRQGEVREVAAAKLATLAETWGLNYDSRLGAVLADENPAQGEQLQALKEVIRDSLKPLLMGLEELLGQEGETGLAHTARHLVDRVVLLQLVNTAEQQTGEPGVVLQGLVRLEDQEVPFYLKLKNRRRKARPGEGQDTCQVLVYLATPRLGQVMGRLVLSEGLLTCEFTVERSQAARLFNSLLPSLRGKLQDLPWRVNLLPCRVQNPGAVHAAGSREFGFALPREGLDVLV